MMKNFRKKLVEHASMLHAEEIKTNIAIGNSQSEATESSVINFSKRINRRKFIDFGLLGLLASSPIISSASDFYNFPSKGTGDSNELIKNLF